MAEHLFSVGSDNFCDGKLEGLIHEEDDVEEVSRVRDIDRILLQTYHLL